MADINRTPPGYEDPEKSIPYDNVGIKTAHNFHDQDVEIQNGHLAELEVDMDRVLEKAEEEGDYSADTSPFPQVRAVVPETDDLAIPVNTFRAWFLGIVRSYRCSLAQNVFNRTDCVNRSLSSSEPA